MIVAHPISIAEQGLASTFNRAVAVKVFTGDDGEYHAFTSAKVSVYGISGLDQLILSVRFVGIST